MKYETVVAILDGVPDCQGDVLGPNVGLPNDSIPVRQGFEGPVIGKAVVRLDADKIIAEIEIDDSVEPSLVETQNAVVGGFITGRNGPSIEAWTLTNLGLTSWPSDTRLPKLKRKS